jgi:hypothetical protein
LKYSSKKIDKTQNQKAAIIKIPQIKANSIMEFIGMPLCTYSKQKQQDKTKTAKKLKTFPMAATFFFFSYSLENSGGIHLFNLTSGFLATKSSLPWPRLCLASLRFVRLFSRQAETPFGRLKNYLKRLGC